MKNILLRRILSLLLCTIFLFLLTSCALDFRKATEITTAEEETKNQSFEFTGSGKETSSWSSTEPDAGSFDNALVLGDSRMVGVQLNCDMGNATFFALVGLTVAGIPYEYIDVEGVGNINLDGILEYKDYDRIYISLGVNDLSCYIEDIMVEYVEIIEKVHNSNPNVPIYLMANLHVTQYYSSTNDVITNEKIDQLNAEIKKLCDGKWIIYLDPNTEFDDQTGALRSDYSSDGIHMEMFAYELFGEWLKKQ